MKRPIVILAAASLLLAGCATRFVATDTVQRNLDVCRTIWASDTTSLAGSPYAQWPHNKLTPSEIVDFRTDKDSMRYAYHSTAPRGQWELPSDSTARQLRPRLTTKRQFRFFTTRYIYKAEFQGIDSTPVPLGDYLTEEEQQLLFRHNDTPHDWNGADMYALLDQVNEKYAKWMSHCMFESEYQTYMAETDSIQQRLLSQYHDELLRRVLEVLPERQWTLAEAAKGVPDLDFLAGIQGHLGNLQNNTTLALLEQFDADVRVLWRIEMPGGHTEEYMISAERLLTGDYTIECTSHALNWWAIILTALVAAALCIAPSILRNRRIR